MDQIPEQRVLEERIPFRLHPRVFDALGKNLVTDDIVAIIELVKNSYDAFAENVCVRFVEHSVSGKKLVITDDGLGMTRDTIENVWCMVATPYKSTNSSIERHTKVRRVVGDKGLGRLSVARLGRRLDMLTQAPGSPCWEVFVDWSALSNGDDVSESFVICREYQGEPVFNGSGTKLTISGLNEQWNKTRIEDLKENLSRLISPFSAVGDFNIYVHGHDDSMTDVSRIKSHRFLSYPKYSIKGYVDTIGNVEAVYNFSPLTSDSSGKKLDINLAWERIYNGIDDRNRFNISAEAASCGPFSFEMRAWDIDGNSIGEIVDEFGGGRRNVRNAIRAHKGISVYRDGVLVLPKSDNTRDWLGLDLRRVSNVGRRLSTSQLVGYVAISAESNPMIADTSDRERLVETREVHEFQEIIRAVVAVLGIQRYEDRVTDSAERPMEDLFANLSAEPLIERIRALASEGASAADAVSAVHEFGDSLESTRKTIETRFVHYSRLAAIGSIAAILVHEIRNRTTIFGNAIRFFRRKHRPRADRGVVRQLSYADRAVRYLEGLADRFAPLASRSFGPGRRRSSLEVQIRDCILMIERDLRRNGIKCHVPDSETIVSVHPGVLDAIVLNLVTNAIYWMTEVPKGNRHLYFEIKPNTNSERVFVWVHDTGPGIDQEDEDRVFHPGVTRKPGGIGMGLTVASELVAGCGGQMALKQPGTKGGASFVFDLPLIN